MEYPLQIHGFDPNFHFVGMTFNPELFVDMKDKFFLLNGRSYPDTVAPGPQATQSPATGRCTTRSRCPPSSIFPRAERLFCASSTWRRGVSRWHRLGVPMKEVGFNAKLLRDQDGNNMEFYTNSITLGGGESLDVILDASDAGCGYGAGAPQSCIRRAAPSISTLPILTTCPTTRRTSAD